MTPLSLAPSRDGAGSVPIQSVIKAIDILDCLARRAEPTSISEISAQLKLHKSTVSRLVGTLEARGLIRRDAPTGHCQLGLRVLEMAGVVLEGFDLRAVAQPHLIRLAEVSRETVSLGVLDRDEAVNIAQVLSPESIKHVGWIGRRNPLHCTSGGRVFLAFGPGELVDRAVERGLPRRTPLTVTDPAGLAQELDRVRRQGYAAVVDEFEVGVTGLAAPIHDRQGTLIGACGITGPTFRLAAGVIPARADQLLETVSRISRDLGLSDGTH